MKLCETVMKKLILIIVLISILITFFATPVSNAALNLEEGEFYYSGTTEGSYKPTSVNIFSWILNALGDIADWILGMLTLGIRMVFVGWTALIEKLLTWGIESTSGIRADGSVVNNDSYGVDIEADSEGNVDIILESPTDLSGVTDSSNNVTVEAIVYNKVAAFNADIFNSEFDRTLSATGHKLVCDKCEQYTDEKGLTRYKAKYVEDCCSGGEGSASCSASCSCDGCDACVMYMAQLQMDEPVIFELRNTIAMWYYIIRLLAMAAMLLVLIAVGIKMAISTIASDKALYKRMLVDWVIGIILIFTLHYFMVFVVTLNSIMVKTIEESAKEVNKASLELAVEELGLKIEEELASKDLEIIIYDEVRTRAYDARLSNGVMGMVMYMSLVFLAVKFTVIYIKRLLTIMVLTLMAPAIGVAYALQKVLNGKSTALKTWMTEYIMNVIIQIVHALIYAIFISQALILSLTNISGMLIALILMNYTSKAEETFKKIFKFGGKDSLLGHTDNAMDALKENVQAAKGLVTGAKPAAKILTNTPYAKALKAVGKAAVGAAVLHASNNYKTPEQKEEQKYKKQWDKEFDKVSDEFSRRPARSDEDAVMKEIQAEVEKRLKEKGIIDPKVKKAEEESFLGTPKQEYEAALADSAKKLEDAQKAYEEAQANGSNDAGVLKKAYEDVKQEHEEAQANMEKYNDLTTLTTKDIITGHKEKLLDVENHFKVKKPNSLFDLKTRQENYHAVTDQLFGSVYFDSEKMKYVRADDGQLKSENLLGLTKDDKKILKEEILAPMAKSITGIASTFVGMGMAVTEPKVGLSLLAMGVPATYKTFHRGAVDNKKYKFSRFSAGAMKKISNNLQEAQDKEFTKDTAERTKKERPGFVEKFKSGDIKAVTLGVAFAPVMAVGYTASKVMNPAKTAQSLKNSGAQVANLIRSDNKMESIANVGKGAVKSTAKFTGNMIKSTAELFAAPVTIPVKATRAVAKFATNNVNNSNNSNHKTEKNSIPRNLGSYAAERFTRKMSIFGNLEKVQDHVLNQRKKLNESIREDTTKLIGIQQQAELDVIVAAEFAKFDEEIKADLNDKGYDYNAKTGMKTRKETVVEDDLIVSKETNSKPNDKLVDSMLEEVLDDFEKKGRIDFSSKGQQREAIEKLTTKLKAAKIISESEDATSIFKGGEAALVKTMKGKASKREEGNKVSKEMRKLLTADELKVVQTTTRAAGKDADVGSVLTKISQQFNPTKDGSRKAVGSEVASKVDTNRTGDRSVTGNTGDRVVVFSGSGSEADKKNTLVAQYVSKMVEPPRREKVTESDSKALDSKKKVSEALKAMLSVDNVSSENVTQGNTETSVETSVEKMMKTSKKADAINEVSTSYGLSESEATSATKMLEKLLEMKKMNQVAIGDYNMKNGSKEYVKARADKSSLAVQVGYLDKENKKIEVELEELKSRSEKLQENATISSRDRKLENESIVRQRSNLEGKREEIKKKLPTRKEELLKSRVKMHMAGPGVNLNKVLKNIEQQATPKAPQSNGVDKKRKAGDKK